MKWATASGREDRSCASTRQHRVHVPVPGVTCGKILRYYICTGALQDTRGWRASSGLSHTFQNLPLSFPSRSFGDRTSSMGSGSGGLRSRSPKFGERPPWGGGDLPAGGSVWVRVRWFCSSSFLARLSRMRFASISFHFAVFAPLVGKKRKPWSAGRA